MKILLITDGIPPEVLGGTGRIVWELAKGLQKNGHTVSVITAGEHPGVTMEEGVRVHRLPKWSLRWSLYHSVFSAKRAQEIDHVIATFQPDVIHAHTIAWQCGYRWIALAAKRDIPIFATAHDVMHVACARVFGTESSFGIDLKDLRRYLWRWNPLRRMLIRNSLSKCTQVFAVSNALKIFLERFGIPHVTMMHNGIDTEFWKPQMTQAEAREAVGIPKDAPVFLLAGRLGIDKGTTLIAETLPENAHVILAGAANLGEFASIQNRVHFFPMQSAEQMRMHYTACDAVLVPSRCLDCFPTVCLEGMAMERPVLATSWGGAKESVDDGKTGWVMDPLDAEAWRTKMAWCAEHRDALAEFGRAGRARMQDRFAQHTYIQELEKAYSLTQGTHVLLLVPDMNGKSGWSRAALDLAQELRARGHRVTALVAERSESGIEEHVLLHPPTKLLDNPLLCAWDAWKLQKAVRVLQPDVVHAIAEPYALPMGLLSRPGAALCATVHGSYAAIPFHRNAFARWCFARALRRSDRIITVSNFTREYLMLHAASSVNAGMLRKKICVVPNGIDLSRFPSALSARKTEQRRHILSVGALKPRKGILQSIEACAILKQQGVEFHYDIIGSVSELPAYVATLRQAIANHGLDAHVTLHDAVSEEALQSAYAKADVFLMPSTHEGLHVEGFGIVFLEANAWGVPVIGPNTGGCPEAILNGKTGYIVDPDHPPMIAEALRNILKENRIEPSACRQWAEEHSMEHIAAMVEAVYRDAQATWNG
jgi:glycosyltransferase involved in cell wall biosynthesis